MSYFKIFMILFISLSLSSALFADAKEDFAIKRKEVFEFTKKPSITIDGDKRIISFSVKDYCDVSVVIEDEQGKILRHLAYGVLGAKAPQPLQKNSLSQKLVWDGKNNAGKYVSGIDKVVLKVSLGLKPLFEKALYWNPKKLSGLRRKPLVVPQSEGVYVYNGAGVEHVRLFDHDGEYVKTVYPFPASQIKKVKGLEWNTYPDGYKVPKKRGYWHSTYLTGGAMQTNASPGSAASGFAVHKGKVVSVGEQVCFFNTAGNTGEFNLYGGISGIKPPKAKMGHQSRKLINPKSVAMSPDGKWVYFTGFYQNTETVMSAFFATVAWKHFVTRVEYGSNKPPEIWLGQEKSGKDEKSFDRPTSLCVDNEGFVYVADQKNDRVQIFSPEGKLYKSIKVSGPAIVQLHHKTQELYVFSWTMAVDLYDKKSVKPILRIFKSKNSLELLKEIKLPLDAYRGNQHSGRYGHFDEVHLRASLDSWVTPARVWLWASCGGSRKVKRQGLEIYEIKKKKLKLYKSWQEDVLKTVKKWKPASLQRQRLFVDERNGNLYVGEATNSGTTKTFRDLIKINPNSGKVELEQLPYSAEDMALDIYGHAYLRSENILGRFALDTWREVPFDYGEERKVQFSSFTKKGKVISGLIMPGNRPVYWHEAGMGINPQGDIVVNCANSAPRVKKGGKKKIYASGKKYTPSMYNGRYRYSEIHVWDKHGQIKSKDVVQGLPDGHGTLIDKWGDIYVLMGGSRIYQKNKDLWFRTGTVAKFKPGKGRLFVTGSKHSGSIPLPLEDKSVIKGLPGIQCGTRGEFWIKGAEWTYGGIGFVKPAAPCQCWNVRFAIDFFGRSFLPESKRNQIAVLDSNGNLVLHIGQYGNADSQGAKSKAPLGGDEVGLIYANYVATQSDKRLYIADPGNQRIVSVALNYHVSNKTILKIKINK